MLFSCKARCDDSGLMYHWRNQMVMEPASALAVMMAARGSAVRRAMATDPQPPGMGMEDEVKRPSAPRS